MNRAEQETWSQYAATVEAQRRARQDPQLMALLMQKIADLDAKYEHQTPPSSH